MASKSQATFRTLGSSGLAVFPIGLGCMSLSGVYGKSEDEQGIRVVHHAIDRGVNFVDSSDMYGWGHNETLLGKALAGGRRGKVVLATKFGQTQQPGRRQRRRRPARVRQGGLRGEPQAPGCRRDRPLLPASRRSARCRSRTPWARWATW